jgi:hypothetical protein
VVNIKIINRRHHYREQHQYAKTDDKFSDPLFYPLPVHNNVPELK